MAVAARIKYFRHVRDYSQEDLALRANINPAYFGQVERGLKCPTIDTLYKIARALDVPLPELLRTDAPPASSSDGKLRLKELLSRVPEDKLDKVLNVIENIVDLF
ncbi:helix-turn-helix domain-containing protein [Dysosmobacter sp.]|uniref:helix-turn-helix domain-containing protein n=1 Tax=Dysosmobacter sp. TaxID=2591382 RepID=UPI002A8D5A6C|nr:helix-turn-helix transcriptional regulator [Dysosmobacter sp.]MDY3985463.1 helix-turn-helix transcriptional regulator [Dysosmobacter sp.]